jgi:hypothetical protein
MQTFVEKYAPYLAGTLSGFDRILFRGTLQRLVARGGMTSYLSRYSVLLKEFEEHAKGVTKRIREAAEAQAKEAGVPFEYLNSSRVSKEEKARQVARERGITAGPVCYFSALEVAPSITVTSDGKWKRAVHRPRKCLHLYRYEIHPQVGWMHTRLQTWFPFTVQVCLNGREWLSHQMDAVGMGYERYDNCFLDVDDFDQAQALANQQLETDWPALLDGIRRELHPLHEELFQEFSTGYYWTVHQSEWATDVVFSDPEKLRHLMPHLIRYAMTHQGCGDVLKYFGYQACRDGRTRRNFDGEVISDMKEWMVGTRVKHRARRNSLKLYDKIYRRLRAVLRAEFTMNQPSGYKVFRPKDGTDQCAWQGLRKGVADLHRRAEVSQGCNGRYLKALAAADDPVTLQERLDKISRRTELKGRAVRALRPHDPEDLALFAAVNRAEFADNGMRNADLRQLLYGSEDGLSPEEIRRRSGRVTRKLRLLRAHGLIRKRPKTHRYDLTDIGRETINALLTARQTPINALFALAA